jgi:hypothetical protein
MEYWNTGFGGLGSFFMDGMDQKIKSDHDPLLNPTIPFFHSSKGGSSTFHYSMGYLTAKTTPLGITKAWSSGPGFFIRWKNQIQFGYWKKKLFFFGGRCFKSSESSGKE